MNMTIWQSILMGLVSGFTELLPVSAEAHRALMRCLTGVAQEDALFRLIIHAAALFALIWCQHDEIKRLQRTRKLLRLPPKRRKHHPDQMNVYVLRLLRTALVPLVFARLFTRTLAFVGDELQILAFSLLANGVVLLIPALVRNGNKDPRNMPRLDGILMGLGSGLSVIPGFSQLGCTVSAGISRGVDRKFALKFAYLLMIPGLSLHLMFDLIAIVTGGAAAFSAMGLLIAFIGGVFCFFGSVLAYRLMNFLVFASNFSGFSYYCFGAGLFCFLLFLTV